MKTFKNWNENLHKGAEEFLQKHPDITLLLYSSYDIFEKIYEDPVKYNFNIKDRKVRRGAMWMDHIHPTSKMHAVIAKDMEDFLYKFPRVLPAEQEEGTHSWLLFFFVSVVVMSSFFQQGSAYM